MINSYRVALDTSPQHKLLLINHLMKLTCLRLYRTPLLHPPPQMKTTTMQRLSSPIVPPRSTAKPSQSDMTTDIQSNNITIIQPMQLIPNKLALSKYKLLFIQYTPNGTMFQQWYLVQVYLRASMELNNEYKSACTYYCDFIAKHRPNVGISDSMSQWWPNWYRYSRDSIYGDLVFGFHI